MKHARDRVIAIDYFRGICILVILFTHSIEFSKPFAYLSGAGRLWVGAAEMFFLLSGLTFGIVRSKLLENNFRELIAKSWRRAAFLYLLNTFAVLASITLGLFLLSHNLNNNIPAAQPISSGSHLLWQVLDFSYSSGWANFLMYYAMYMLIAPFVFYALKTRFWPLVLLGSASLYVVSAISPFNILPVGAYTGFGIWQLYFIFGLTLARFRVPIIGRFYRLTAITRSRLSTLVISLAALVLALNIVAIKNPFLAINRLAVEGWLPIKARSAYVDFMNSKPTLDSLLMNSRTGILRPFVCILFLATAYVIYQKYKQSILSWTGQFVNAMGRDTLWIFVAQAFVIPILAAIPLQRNLFNNTLLTAVLILSMWLLTKRRLLIPSLKNYGAELKNSYNAGKYSYLYRSENDA
jgi:hypothetical protein